MKIITRVVSSVLLVSFVMLSLCACDNKKQTDAARALCETFCEDVKNGDADKLMTYLGDSGVTADELKELITPSAFNSEEKAFSSAIKDTIRYNVQDPVYDYKAKTATVYLSWGEADYNNAEALLSQNIIEFKTALASSPEQIITTGVTVDLNGENPRILNAKEVIDAVYEFNTVDHGIMPGVLSDYYTDGSFILAPKGIYSNTVSIGVRLNFNKDLFNYRFIPGITYTVSRGNDVIIASDVIALEEDSINFMPFNSSASSGLPSSINLLISSFRILFMYLFKFCTI